LWLVLKSELSNPVFLDTGFLFDKEYPMNYANLVLKDLNNGGAVINVPGEMGSSGVISFGLAERVPFGNAAVLVLASPDGGEAVNVPVTIENDGRVVIGTAKNTPRKIVYLNVQYNGAPLWVEAVISDGGTVTIAGATFSNPAVAPVYDGSEIGLVDASTVVVRFSIPVASADFANGVTIKKNTVAQNISSAVLQSNPAVVYYVLDAPADADDVLTWEYSKAAGDIGSKLDNTLLENVTAKTVTNHIAPQFGSGEIGTVSDTTLVVMFDSNMASADFAEGVTIEVNSTPVTISSATRQADHKEVQYVIDPAVVNGDDVTWEYDGTGSIAGEANLVALGVVAAQTITNNVV
jgi:hypothetical protein